MLMFMFLITVFLLVKKKSLNMVAIILIRALLLLIFMAFILKRMLPVLYYNCFSIVTVPFC